MKTNLKAILYFFYIIVGFEIFSKLIYSTFNFKALFSMDYLLGNILLEIPIQVFSAILTYLLIKNWSSTSLGSTILKSLIFGGLYAILAFIAINFFNTFFYPIYDQVLTGFSKLQTTMLNYIPHGIKQGLIYIFILNYVNSNNNQDVTENKFDLDHLKDSL